MTDKKVTTSQNTRFPSTMTDEQIRDYLIGQTVRDIQTTNLTAAQVKMLYDAIISKVEWKTCYQCGKLGVVIEGTYTYPGGDMSKPKAFVCRRCNHG